MVKTNKGIASKDAINEERTYAHNNVMGRINKPSHRIVSTIAFRCAKFSVTP